MPTIDFHNHFYPPEYIKAIEQGPSAVRITHDSDGNPCLHYPGDYNVAVPGHRDIDVRVDHEDAKLAHYKAAVVHRRLAGKQAVDARRQLLRFEPRPGRVERWRNETQCGLGDHLWRCQHRRDQRT